MKTRVNLKYFVTDRSYGRISLHKLKDQIKKSNKVGIFVESLILYFYWIFLGLHQFFLSREYNEHYTILSTLNFFLKNEYSLPPDTHT